RRRIARMMILTFYIHHHLQKSVGSGRCHHWRRSLPSLAAAAANHVPARCQPKKHALFPSAVPPAPCLSCAASPKCAPFRSSSTMLTCMSSLFSESFADSCAKLAYPQPFRVDVPSIILSAGCADLRLLRVDGTTVFSSAQVELFFVLLQLISCFRSRCHSATG
ncbi:MAG: hypothetical protein IJ892_13540, partial [Prevotella sp.]|nr:hypothetical protein [Prevotella sp.]